MSDLQITIVDWAATPALRRIRQAVFVEEQQVPADLEWDERDPDATHFLMSVDGVEVGTARLLADGHIGRVALLPAVRGKGFGQALMHAVMNHAQQIGIPRLELSAQTHALGFYQLLGFVVCSDEYLEAGIPHRSMCWPEASPASDNC